jgi:hypothetical protein
VQGPSYADENPHSLPKKPSNEGFDPSIPLKKSNTKLTNIKLQKEKLTILRRNSNISNDSETGLHLTSLQPHPTNPKKPQKDISDEEIIFSSEDNDWGHTQAPRANPKQ